MIPVAAGRMLRSMNIRALIPALLPVLLFCLLAPAPGAAEEIELTLPDPLSAELSEGRLKTLQDNIVETGIGRDAISSIDAPQFIDVENASLVVEDEEVVFIAQFAPDDVRIYPHSVMVWHQVVNDTTDSGERVAITYCPMSGSLVGYRAKVGQFTTNFGVTGMLVNDNTILYDRATNSMWPQLLGVARGSRASPWSGAHGSGRAKSTPRPRCFRAPRDFAAAMAATLTATIALTTAITTTA